MYVVAPLPASPSSCLSFHTNHSTAYLTMMHSTSRSNSS